MSAPDTQAIVDEFSNEIREAAELFIDTIAAAERIPLPKSYRDALDLGISAGMAAAFAVLHRHGWLKYPGADA